MVLLWAFVLASITAFWFDDINMALIIAVAIVINLLTAAAGGALLPSLLKKLKIDPALAGGVAVTTLTDVVGFFIFLGLSYNILSLTAHSVLLSHHGKGSY